MIYFHKILNIRLQHSFSAAGIIDFTCNFNMVLRNTKSLI